MSLESKSKKSTMPKDNYHLEIDQKTAMRKFRKRQRSITDKTIDSELKISGAIFPSKSNRPRNKHGIIKRPMNAFMLFGRAYRPGMAQMFPKVPNTQISIYLGNMWHSMTSEQQKPFYEEAKRIRHSHQHDYPEWSDEMDNQQSIKYIKKLREEYKGHREIFLPEEDKTHIQVFPSIVMCAQAGQCMSMNTKGEQEAPDLIPEVAAATESIVSVQDSNNETFNEGDFQLLNAAPSEQDVTHQNNVNFNGTVFQSKSKRPRNKHGIIKRPMNAFMLFGRAYRPGMVQMFPKVPNAQISIYLGNMWHSMTSEQQKPFYEEAKRIRYRHQHDYPEWSDEMDNQRSIEYIKKLQEEYKLPRKIFLPEEDKTHIQLSTPFSLCEQADQCISMNTNGMQEAADLISEVTAVNESIVPIQGTNSNTFNDDEFQFLHATPWGQDDMHQNNVDFNDCCTEEAFSQVELGNYQNQNQSMMTTTETNMHTSVTTQLGDQTSLPMDLQGLWDLVEIATASPTAQIANSSADCHTEESLSTEELDNYQDQNQSMMTTTETNMHTPVATQLGDQTSLPMDLQGLWDFIEISTAPTSTQITPNSTDCRTEEPLSQAELGNYQNQNQPMTMTTTTVTNMHPPVTTQLGDQTSLPMDLQGLWDLVEISTTPPPIQTCANSKDCHAEESLFQEDLCNYHDPNQSMTTTTTTTTETNMHAPVTTQLGDQTSLPMDLQGLWDFIEISTAPPSTQIAANSADCDSYSWSDVPCENVLDSSMVPMSSVECTVGPTPWLNLDDDNQCHLLQNYHSMQPFQEQSIQPDIADDPKDLIIDCDSYTWSGVPCENDFDSSIVPRDSIECTVCTTSWLNLDDDTQCHLLQDYHSMEPFKEKSVQPVIADNSKTLNGGDVLQNIKDTLV